MIAYRVGGRPHPASRFSAEGTRPAARPRIGSPAAAAVLEQLPAADLQMPFQGVLGQDGFLDKFAVTFNKYCEYFIAERPGDFHNRVGRHPTSDPTRTADHHWLRGRPVRGTWATYRVRRGDDRVGQPAPRSGLSGHSRGAITTLVA